MKITPEIEEKVDLYFIDYYKLKKTKGYFLAKTLVGIATELYTINNFTKLYTLKELCDKMKIQYNYQTIYSNLISFIKTASIDTPSVVTFINSTAEKIITGGVPWQPLDPTKLRT